jgi:2-desacetyl-2-hydroxyethyl bacteriochlorophyllide A dehydrogenase
MKAAVLVEPRNIQIKDVETPDPGRKEVLIKLSLAGICGTDYSLYHGKFDVSLPIIPGHEGIGRIVKLGSEVSGLGIGQRVAIQPNFPCGKCGSCLSGRGNVCPSKIRLGLDVNGAFAEYVRVPADYVWTIPDDLDDVDAVLAEPFSVAAHALKVTSPRSGDRTLVFGAGVIGLMILQLAALQGACVSAYDIEQNRLKLAKKLGASQVLISKDHLASARSTFDVIYEASGSEAALAEAIDLAAPGGKIIVLGLPGNAHPLETALIVRKELHILGSMIYTNEFPDVLKILSSGQIRTEPLISKKLPLNQLDRAMAEFASPERVKMVVAL